MTKRKGPWEGEKKGDEQIFIERERSEYEAGSVTIINLNALVGEGGG